MEQEKSITFGKFLRVAFGGWKKLLIIAAAFTVVGTLTINFAYNKSKSTYTTTFSYNKSDLNQNMFADGSSFFYTEIFSRANFDRAAATDESLKTIDLDKMFETNAFTFSKKVEDDISYYTLNIPSKYFTGYAQAKLFFKEVSDYPLDRENSLLKKENFESSLIAFDSASTFESEIKFLKSHADSLLNSYKAVLENEKIEIGASARAAAEAGTAAIVNIVGVDDALLTTLAHTINANGFVKDYESEEAKSFEATKIALQAEYDSNQAKIQAFKDEIASMGSTTVILNEIDEALAELIARNAEVKEEIDAITLKIAKQSDTSEEYLAAKAAYAERLVSIRNKLSDCTSQYITFLQLMYGKSDSASFADPSVITTTGVVSIPVAIVVSLLAGVVVGAIVNLIVDRKKFNED